MSAPSSATSEHNDSVTESLAAAAGVLAGTERIWLGTHIDPDGDAIGSLLGLGELLRTDGKLVTAACRDPAPYEVDFLPGVDTIVGSGPDHHDVAVALDAADIGRLGPLLDDGAWPRMPTIVIDHHVSNPRFGQVNVVDPKAASTAEILVALADVMGRSIHAEAATCLLTGIVTDTLGFRTSNTRAATLEHASRLMRDGASLPRITQMVFYRRPLAALRAQGLAVNSLRTVGGTGIVALSRRDLAEAGLADRDISGLSSFLISADELDAVAVLRERDDGTIDVSMRSKPHISLVPAAVALGGGGHPQAAGASLQGPLETAVRTVLQTLGGTLDPSGETDGSS